MPAPLKPPLALRVPFPTIFNSRPKLLIPAFLHPDTSFSVPSESIMITFVPPAHSLATPMAAPGLVGFIVAPLRTILAALTSLTSVLFVI